MGKSYFSNIEYNNHYKWKSCAVPGCNEKFRDKGSRKYCDRHYFKSDKYREDMQEKMKEYGRMYNAKVNGRILS